MPSLSKLRRQIEAQVPQKVVRDVVNRLRYGRLAPQSDEVLYLDPRGEVFNFKPGAHRFRRYDSGRVLAGDWDLAVMPFEQNIKHRAIAARYREGLSWEETGLFDHLLGQIAKHGEVDKCRNLDDIIQRYKAMDRMVEQVQREGRFKLRESQPGFLRREHGGVLVHIDRRGRGIRSGGGMHRFSIARVLGLPEVPVQVGVVHPDAITSGTYHRLRKSVFEG